MQDAYVGEAEKNGFDIKRNALQTKLQSQQHNGTKCFIVTAHTDCINRCRGNYNELIINIKGYIINKY